MEILDRRLLDTFWADSGEFQSPISQSVRGRHSLNGKSHEAVLEGCVFPLILGDEDVGSNFYDRARIMSQQLRF